MSGSPAGSTPPPSKKKGGVASRVPMSQSDDESDNDRELDADNQMPGNTLLFDIPFTITNCHVNLSGV